METGIEAITAILADSLRRLGVQPTDTDIYVTEISAAKDLNLKVLVLKKMTRTLVELADLNFGKQPSERPVTEGSKDEMAPSPTDYWRLEEILQRYESSIRDHVRIEQSIKIYSDSLKERVEVLELEIDQLKKEHKKEVHVA